MCFGAALAPTKIIAAKDSAIQDFSYESSADLHYGCVKFTVPANRDTGADFELWEISKYNEVGPDKRREYLVVSDIWLMPRDEFIEKINRRTESTDGVASVFVHGHNNDFFSAFKRAAQLDRDMNLDGSMVFFAWSVGQGNSIIVESALKTHKAINPLLQLLAAIASSNIVKINIVAHSMGATLAFEAMQKAPQHDSASFIQKFIGEIFFVSPYLATASFTSEAPKLRSGVERITIFCSPEDSAVRAGRQLDNQKNIGLCEGDEDDVFNSLSRSSTVFRQRDNDPKIDVIDITDAVEHFPCPFCLHTVWAANHHILRDMANMLSPENSWWGGGCSLTL